MTSTTRQRKISSALFQTDSTVFLAREGGTWIVQSGAIHETDHKKLDPAAAGVSSMQVEQASKTKALLIRQALCSLRAPPDAIDLRLKRASKLWTSSRCRQEKRFSSAIDRIGSPQLALRVL